jgi:hypothetical protein
MIPAPTALRFLLAAAVAVTSATFPCSAQSSSPSKKKPPAKSQPGKSTKPTGKPAPKPSPKPSPKPTPAATGAGGAIGAVAPMPRVYAPTRARDAAPKYPWRKEIVTTIFWIGEQPTENNPVPNHASSWDMEWQLNYGGYDNPDRSTRTWDFCPKGFTPGLNPFYVALPFNDITNPVVASRIPWYKQRKAEGAKSVCKDVWIAIRSGNKSCFAQWQDCGPFTTDDHPYVFGGKPPVNRENNGAGLDVSPAVRDFLGITSGARCDWRFCDESEVPDGPWSRYGSNNSFLTKDARNNERIRRQYEELVRKREEWLKKQAATRVVN